MKSIMFKTKIFHEGKMYLLVSDVTKMMEISEKAFCKKYSDKIVEIPGCRKCIAETDFNLLISDDKELFKKMGMLEVTKVETLRSEIASIRFNVNDEAPGFYLEPPVGFSLWS